jgi:hypothetical protein
MKRHWLGVAAAIAAACVISLFSARRIEAQYASPVKVMNTTSAPAVTSNVDEKGRTPYERTVDRSGQGLGSCAGATGCSFGFGVPAGHRLVIEQIGGYLTFNGNPTSVYFSIGLNNPQIGQNWGISPMTATGDGSVVFHQDVRAYVDTFFQVDAIEHGAPFNGGIEHITVTGYLVDCNAAPCAAVVR